MHHGAGFNGGSLLDYNKDGSSYVMALLFARALLCHHGHSKIVLGLNHDATGCCDLVVSGVLGM